MAEKDSTNKSPWHTHGLSLQTREARLRREAERVGLKARKYQGQWYFTAPNVRYRFELLVLRELSDAERFVTGWPERQQREVQEQHQRRQAKGQKRSFDDVFSGIDAVRNGLLARLRAACQLLGVAWPPTEETISSAFRQRAAELHPDRGGDAEAFRALVSARDLLLHTLRARQPSVD